MRESYNGNKASGTGVPPVRFVRAERPHHHNGSPIILITVVAGRQIVCKCCERCAAAGVKPGMTLSHARALLTSDAVHVQDCDPVSDNAALKALAMWAARFSPIVAADSPDGLLLDITGCQRVHGGERRLVNAVGNSLAWLGFQARVACASTFACAWAMARFGSEDRCIVADGAERQSLNDLAIQALRIDQRTIDGLLEVNVDRIGHLFDLPRNDLAERFGEELLLRIDQATGEAMETIASVRPVQPPRVEKIFDGPVKQLEGILLTVRRLVEELAAELAKLESGVLRIDMDVQRIDAQSLRKTITLSHPSRDVRHLWSLLKPKAEALHLGFGVERIGLTAARMGRLPHEQSEHWRTQSKHGGSQLDRAAGELIDAISSRLGPDRALQVHPVESYMPEKAFRYAPVMNGGGEGATRQAWTGDSSISTSQVTRTERPSLLLSQSELIDVIAVAPEGPPSWLRWRGIEHNVISSFGAERIANEWWRETPSPLKEGELAPARDYFKVQIDSGRWLWVFRQLDSRHWFVHGEWA